MNENNRDTEVPAPVAVARVRILVNGEPVEKNVEPALNLLDFLREHGFTGTHAGCEHGVCGTCTVLLDDEPIRSCLVLAVQVKGAAVTTVEGLGTPEDPHPLQLAFSRHLALQCGFCTPGFLILAEGLRRSPGPVDEVAVRDALSSNLCRCTGYASIVSAVLESLELPATSQLGVGVPGRAASRHHRPDEEA